MDLTELIVRSDITWRHSKNITPLAGSTEPDWFECYKALDPLVPLQFK